MMWFLGFITGAGLAGLIAIAKLWRDNRPDRHTRYIKAWQQANWEWKHPRSARHRKLRRAPRHDSGWAPMPMDLWGDGR